jgi:hypothetical protein
MVISFSFSSFSKNVFKRGKVKIDSAASGGGQEKLNHVLPLASA